MSAWSCTGMSLPPWMCTLIENEAAERHADSRDRDGFLMTSLKHLDPAIPEANNSGTFQLHEPMYFSYMNSCVYLCLRQLELGFCQLQLKDSSRIHFPFYLVNFCLSFRYQPRVLPDSQIGVASLLCAFTEPSIFHILAFKPLHCRFLFASLILCLDAEPQAQVFLW